MGWQNVIRIALRAKGWSMDSTHDLARVMRLPGTKSHKRGGTPVDVEGIEGPSWEPEDFEVWMPQGTAAPNVEEAAQLPGGVTLDPVNQGLRINNQASAAGAGIGTIRNTPNPIGGDPAFWLPVNIGGTVYAAPFWPL